MDAQERRPQNFFNQVPAYHAAIREVLLRDWDPIGVGHAPEAQDEYDGYISRILGVLLNREPLHTLVDYLWEAETKKMALRGNRHRTRQVAERLLRLPDELAGSA
jgi:hypothetical protein